MARTHGVAACVLTVALLSIAGGGAGAAQQTGIKVHGHWTIEVRNPDGTVVTHTEFDNDLVPGPGGGGKVLGDVLGLNRVVSSWQVLLRDDSGEFRVPNQQPCEQNGERTPCVITTAVGAIGSSSPNAVFPTLTVQVPTAGTNAGLLVLSGSATATFAGVITNVNSAVTTCPASFVSGIDCATNKLFGFFTLAPVSVSVAAGQIIQVTVVISFS